MRHDEDADVVSASKAARRWDVGTNCAAESTVFIEELLAFLWRHNTISHLCVNSSSCDCLRFSRSRIVENPPASFQSPACTSKVPKALTDICCYERNA